MKKEFIESNIVLRGKFTPSKFDKLFFIKTDLIKEEEFLENCLFTSDLSRIVTEKVIVHVRSKQVVIANRQLLDDTLIKDIACEIIQSDSSINNAFGLNLKWFVFNDDDIEQHTRNMFYPIKSEIINESFKSDDSAFGYYASKDFLDSRMRMDIKPTLVTNVKKEVEQKILAFEFNFHISSKDDNKGNDLKDKLNNYPSYLSEAQKIIKNYE